MIARQTMAAPKILRIVPSLAIWQVRVFVFGWECFGMLIYGFTRSLVYLPLSNVQLC